VIKCPWLQTLLAPCIHRQTLEKLPIWPEELIETIRRSDPNIPGIIVKPGSLSSSYRILFVSYAYSSATTNCYFSKMNYLKFLRNPRMRICSR